MQSGFSAVIKCLTKSGVPYPDTGYNFTLAILPVSTLIDSERSIICPSSGWVKAPPTTT